MLAIFIDILAAFLISKYIRSLWLKIPAAIFAGIMSIFIALLLSQVIAPNAYTGEQVVARMALGMSLHPVVVLVGLWVFRKVGNKSNQDSQEPGNESGAIEVKGKPLGKDKVNDKPRIETSFLWLFIPAIFIIFLVYVSNHTTNEPARTYVPDATKAHTPQNENPSSSITFSQEQGEGPEEIELSQEQTKRLRVAIKDIGFALTLALNKDDLDNILIANERVKASVYEAAEILPNGELKGILFAGLRGLQHSSFLRLELEMAVEEPSNTTKLIIDRYGLSEVNREEWIDYVLKISQISSAVLNKVVNIEAKDG